MAALAAALALAGVVYVRSAGEGEESPPVVSGPALPADPGPGCGAPAVTDPGDLGAGRTLARCGAGAPAPRPLDRPARVRVAVGEPTEALAPLLVAEALGEFEAENLRVELVGVGDGGEAYAAMARGEIDAVAGDVGAPFFDAVHAGLPARLVLGGEVAREPGNLDRPQTGLWLRADLVGADGRWRNVDETTVLVAGGTGSAALYPIGRLLSQQEGSLNTVDVTASSASAAAEGLRSAAVGGAWLPEPMAGAVAGDPAVRLAATLPGSESIDGTVFSPRLVGPERATGVAFARATIRTINTHLPDGYGDGAAAALAEALGVTREAITAGRAPLFDWELRSGTTTRIQDALVVVGALRYERPRAEPGLVDRTIYREAVGAPGQGVPAAQLHA